MLFNSDLFLFGFLPLVFVLFSLLRTRRARLVLLTIASYVFYAFWDWRFCSLLLLSSVTSYVAAIAIDSSDSERRRRAWLAGSIALDLLILGFFKYFDFFASSAHAIFPQLTMPLLHVVLPVGISFYTFHTISYVADVAAGRVRATRDIPMYLTYVSFFAQLVAGPIVRLRQVATDLAAIDRPLLDARLAEGIGFFVCGLAKKAILADEIGRRVDPLVLRAGELSTPTAWIVAVAFGLQIYFDFSGYTDMAIGLGRIFGIGLPQNFNAPYRALGMSDFWRRWHMSLSSWLRDYLYIGLLGGNRRGSARTAVNVMVTMLLGGLWHGANWTFVAWGAYHGVLLLGERALGERVLRVPSLLMRVATFLLVIVGWVFFRSPDFSVAGAWLGRMAGASGMAGLGPGGGLLILVPIGLLIVAFAPETWDIRFRTGWRWAAAYAVGFVVSYIFMSAGTSPFIYYQF